MRACARKWEYDRGVADKRSTDVGESPRSDPPGSGEFTHLGADAWGALLRVHAAVVPMLDKELQAARRLPLAWYDVLLELNSAPGRRLRMGDLGDRVTLSRTRVSRLVDELATAGLVTREANPDDRRSAYAVLTAQGRTALRGAAPVYLGGIRDHFADILSAQELRTITTALDRVIEQARRSGRASGDSSADSASSADRG
jgi:DNA-binding MarR family transcriptional regulator